MEQILPNVRRKPQGSRLAFEDIRRGSWQNMPTLTGLALFTEILRCKALKAGRLPATLRLKFDKNDSNLNEILIQEQTLDEKTDPIFTRTRV